MTDESVIEWASGWLRDNTPEDPTFRRRFLDGLALELKVRADVRVAADDLRKCFTTIGEQCSPDEVVAKKVMRLDGALCKAG